MAALANLRAIVQALVVRLAGAEPVIFADQNAPRPALPYWTVRVSVGRRVGRETHSQGVTDDGDMTLKGTREATIQLQRYGTDSVEVMQQFREDLFKVTEHEAWQTAGLSLYDTTDVLNIAFTLDGAQREPRAALDLLTRFGTVLIDRVGVIETVDIDATYNDNPDLNDTITVVL